MRTNIVLNVGELKVYGNEMDELFLNPYNFTTDCKNELSSRNGGT